MCGRSLPSARASSSLLPRYRLCRRERFLPPRGDRDDVAAWRRGKIEQRLASEHIGVVADVPAVSALNRDDASVVIYRDDPNRDAGAQFAGNARVPATHVDRHDSGVLSGSLRRTRKAPGMIRLLPAASALANSRIKSACENRTEVQPQRRCNMVGTNLRFRAVRHYYQSKALSH